MRRSDELGQDPGAGRHRGGDDVFVIGVSPGHRPTRDHEFRIHTGVELAGTRLWANGTYEPNACILKAAYRLTWDAYTEQGGSGGEFRYLAVFVNPSASGAVFG
ncbi:hypothetical protein ACIPYQ_09075 [Streptomyces sp. NPDC090045]|uniref:hypothetical protein n=1 Tax=Streptomyces sp. NPDC090045 TaxID=3365927 RepID=UPI003813EE3C